MSSLPLFLDKWLTAKPHGQPQSVAKDNIKAHNAINKFLINFLDRVSGFEAL